MNAEDQTMEEKCEDLMNVVVESRKRFGNKCIDYNEKISQTENAILNLELEIIANFRTESKNLISASDIENMYKDMDDIEAILEESKLRLHNLSKKVDDTQLIVMQLKRDNIGRKMHQPLTAEALLKQAKAKKLDK